MTDSSNNSLRSRVESASTSFWGRNWIVRRARRLGERSLLRDFFFFHISFATLVGALAIGSLWWMSHWMMDESLKKWAVQWVDRLDSLGAPLFISADESEIERIQTFVSGFPEIAFVRYYRPDGSLQHEQSTVAAAELPELLSPAQLERLQSVGEGDNPYVLDRSIHGGELFRASTSLWAESIVSDGLFGFDPEEEGVETRSLLGFIELGLDFQFYHDTMMRRVVRWSAGILLGLMGLAIAGLFGFRRALKPLRNLQEPLSRLAQGELEIPMHDSAGHAELAAINDALATTINALHERDRKLREAANFDQLTGLMGRFGLNEAIAREIERVERERTTSCVLFIDLDQFKYVNDSVGHAGGDRLLVRVAGLIESVVEEDSLVCRYGGDEFILLHKGATRDDAQHLAATIVESMREIQFVENNRAFNVRCSIGISVIDSGALNPEEVLAQADMACHEAKGLGRDRYQLFIGDKGERAQAAADMGWSERLRDALKVDDFSLRFQPIMKIEDGSTTFYEALIRMQGPGRNAILPGAFLPAAERFGLMGDLDFWVIRHAFEKLAKVREDRPDVVFALNLSGIVFSDERLVGYVEEQLEQFGVPGSAVVFEITEQVAIRYIEDANSIMRRIIEMGCRFALDDFGSGFSSFNYLKQLPVEFIKIDGSFIENLANDPADRAIVTSIAEIARTVGMRTVAEHVGDERTLAILGEMGIDYAQGFFIGRPRKALQRPRQPQPAVS